MKSNNQKNNEINAVYGKLPPQAIEVEEAVLGALMLERDTLEAVSDIIHAHSFYKDEHRKIFETIQAVAKKKPVDLLSVTQELKDTNLLENVGGPGYITGLTRRVASAAHIESHARILAEKYYQRQTINKATELIQKSYDGEDVEILNNLWRQSGDSLEYVFTIADTGTHFKQVLEKTISDIEQDCVRATENKTPGITTGFAGLDTNTGGWRDGNLIVLAARPGIGKTSFALHFALEAAKAGNWINFFSLEMNKEDLARILLSIESDVYRSDIRDGYVKSKDWDKINAAVARLENLPILFRDSAGMSVEQIKSAIRKNRKNGRCQMAVVDYLQLVKSSSSKQIRELEVSEISRGLKTSALTENIPILALSQLNRAAEGEIPKLSHLRESGAIEQNADLVLFLYRPDPQQPIIRLKVAKHRWGSLGEIDIYANSQMTHFSENQIIESTEF